MRRISFAKAVSSYEEITCKLIPNLNGHGIEPSFALANARVELTGVAL
jgi:hypothetical protein